MQKAALTVIALVFLNCNSYAQVISQQSSAPPSKMTESSGAIVVQQTKQTESNAIPPLTQQTESNSGTQQPAAINSDPFQNYNRNAYRMNDTLDKHMIRPVTVWYITYIPSPFRLAINNFYNNLRDFVTLGNDVLQLNGMASMQNVMRISINSVFGIAGIIDVSSSLGLMRHKNTFGTTLKVYGWKNSSYYVIPLLGPSTVRDALGMIPDLYFNPTWYIIPGQYLYVSVGLFVVNAIDTRSQFLGFDQILQTSIDPYTTVRDTYLQSIGEQVPQASNESNISIDTLLDNESDANSSTTKTNESGTKSSITIPTALH